MTRRPATVGVSVAALLLAAAPFAAPTAAADPGDDPAPAPISGRYLVTLADQPIATYDGGVAGIPATKPDAGEKVDVTTDEARRYRSHLVAEQNAAAKKVGAKVADHYAVTTNTFTAKLTPAQILKLAATKGVVSVTPERVHKATDDKNSVDYLRLSGRGGLWSALGGTANAGKGVVIGDLDTGIWPENGSFAAPALSTAKPPAWDKYRPYLRGTTTVMRKTDGATFTGTCETGEEFTAADCNRKVISARQYGDAWREWVPEANRADYMSPRDGGGHGSHTASTAAGNANVPASIDGRSYGKISGVAPGAAIAVYKVLWESKDGSQTGGLTSDIVAAIDQATADGVDVINYSIGSDAESPVGDPIETAFRNAAAAGVFISASAGNNGPGASTLDNVAPWTTNVAASTVEAYKGTVVLGNGERYTGISTTLTGQVGPAPLVRSTAVKNADASDADAAVCAPGSLDPAQATGKIVVCDRGVVDRVAKSAEAKRAGAVGMVLVNVSQGSTDGDSHSLPTVHLNIPDSTTVRTYAAGAGATAQLVTGGADIPYPQVAGFSSRGPSLQNNGDVLKPDIAAPGVTILAAVAPPSNRGHDFDFYSGTSMAAPHITGLAAIYLALHPKWSPMAVKSAMMTTARPTLTAEGKTSEDVFAQGAGEVSAWGMLRPGLVYDSSERDWLSYLEGLGIDTGSGAKPIDASDLNSASIAIGDLLGSQTVTRTATAVTPGVYRAAVDLPGVRTTVTPSTLRFTRPGERKTFTVKFDVTTAPVGVAETGSLTWTSGRTSVRSPIVVTPQALRAPARVSGTGASGQVAYKVTSAASAFTATPSGPVSAAPESGTLTGADEYDYLPAVAAGTKAAEITVRFGATSGAAGVTGIVYGRVVDGELVDSQVALADARGVANAVLPKPEAGTYLVAVVQVGSGEAEPGATPYTYQFNAVGGGSVPAGTLSVTPAKATTTPGTPVDVTAAWAGVGTGGRSTGWVEYANGAGTVVSLN
ncbi:S8 family serine peptidase [Streptomyces roseirectus]|uniref:S8 family serine peptidase n=1 Tax=Streptomyces roseirectus TaxID=2768066 RepID=A0A7H0IKV5_9ACTN|nr:S8 family serine peptidase [Streptomyces roseirectus]QNP73421.1 S8 family serine peptidase [Streptomyces roseirectus]